MQTGKIRFRKEGLGRQATYRSEDGRIEIRFAFVGNHLGYYKDLNIPSHQRNKSLAWETVIYGPRGDVIKQLSPRKTVAQAKNHAVEWAHKNMEFALSERTTIRKEWEKESVIKITRKQLRRIIQESLRENS